MYLISLDSASSLNDLYLTFGTTFLYPRQRVLPEFPLDQGTLVPILNVP